MGSTAAEQAALYATLTAALARADALDLTMVAIHIDEARALIAQLPGVSGLLVGGEAATEHG